MVHGEHIARCAHCSLQSKWMLCTFITSIPSYHLWPIGLVATREWQWCRRCITFECFAPTEYCWIDAECVSLDCTTSNLSAQWSKDVTAILESKACLWPSCNIASNGEGQRMSIYSSPLRILPEKITLRSVSPPNKSWSGRAAGGGGRRRRARRGGGRGAV